MPSSFDQAAANNILNAVLIPGNFVAYVAPIKVRLMTTQGNATTNGTEVVNSGGSTYAAQNFGAGTPSAGAASNTAAVTYTNMPAVASPGIQALESWDSGGTPRRILQGNLTAAKVTNLGDTLSFAIGALIETLT